MERRGGDRREKREDREGEMRRRKGEIQRREIKGRGERREKRWKRREGEVQGLGLQEKEKGSLGEEEEGDERIALRGRGAGREGG